jgi:hypothetical protein
MFSGSIVLKNVWPSIVADHVFPMSANLLLEICMILLFFWASDCSL